MAGIEIIGHRGARGEAPENTVAGFAHARTIGLAGVEFDVRLAQDDVLVVIHDATVDRTTNGGGAVADLTAAELAGLDARGTCLSWPEPVGVPTLAEALDVIATFDVIQFEIKHDTPERLSLIVEGIVHEVEQRSLGECSIVTSFDPVAVELVRQHAPELATAFIARPDDARAIETALELGCTQVNLHQYRARNHEDVERAHASDLRVGGGPCDTIDDLEWAIAWGMDTVTSDEPTAMLAHLARVT